MALPTDNQGGLALLSRWPAVVAKFGDMEDFFAIVKRSIVSVGGKGGEERKDLGLWPGATKSILEYLNCSKNFHGVQA